MTDSTGELFRELARLFQATDIDKEQRFNGALELIQDYTGAEAAGIRLLEEERYPFKVSRGYPGEFVDHKSDLLVRSEGIPLRKSGDKPVYECFCGAVLAGELDGNTGNITEFGSLWTGDLPALYESAEADSQGYRLRYTCLEADYRSLALIPLKYGDKISGLLQLNDSRKDAFSASLIDGLEEVLCPLAAAALSHNHELLINELGDIFNTTIPLAEIGEDYRLRRVNDSFRSHFAPDEDRVEGRNCYQVAPGKCCQTDDCPLRQVMDQETEQEAECVKEVAGGEKRFYLETVTPRYNPDGKQTGVVVAFQDITDRKRAEDKMETALAEKQELLEEIQELVENNSRVIADLIELQATGQQAGLNDKGMAVIESLTELRDRLQDF